MGKCSGMEPREEIPEKVLLLYKAVFSLIHEGRDIAACKVEEITKKAGIGKGTAYDYFDTREDIIVSALCFSIKNIYLWMNGELAGQSGFFGKLEYLLQLVEEKMPETDCFLRFIHMTTDTTICGKKLQESAKQLEEQGLNFQNMLEGMIREGIESGELRQDYPMAYMSLEVGAKIIAYITYVHKIKERDLSSGEMKRYLLDGIRKEFGV